MRKILPVLLLCPVLAGCGIDPFAGSVMTNVAMGGATVVSYSVVGKSPLDYGLSHYRQRDCDFRNLKKYGSYCVDLEPTPVDPAVYCYRTIASPDCTNLIDPHNNGNQPIVGPGNLPMNAIPVSTGTSGYSVPTTELPAPARAPATSPGDPLALTEADRDLQPVRPGPSINPANPETAIK
jgi:hypothetical protein